jgi:hypothetical protein
MKKANYIKSVGSIASIALLSLLASCSNEDNLTNTDTISNSSKSSLSKELAITQINASVEESPNVASRAIDDDPSFSTRWSGYGSNVSLLIDFGQEVNLDYLKIATYKGNERKQSFQLWSGTSMSGPWSKFNTKSTSGTTTGLEEFDLTNKTGRYFRIKFTGNSSNLWNTVTDLEMYGTPTSGTTTTTTTTTTPTTPTGTLDPTKKPSGNFDLSKWYLSVPVDKGGGIATSISVSDLNNGYTHSTFFYTGTDGAMVFVNYPKNAPKTSSNTSYSRCELREMLDTSVDDTGLTKNNWVFGNSSSSAKSKAGGVDGTLTATLAVNRVTQTGSSNTQIGRTIIGQIHASSNEPCRLYYHKLTDHSKGAIYVAHETKGGTETFYNMIGSYVKETGSGAGDLDGSPSSPSDGISLNEKFSYTIKTSGTNLYVTISRDGKSDVTETINMSNSSYADDWMYFKAGVYTQNKTATSSTDYDKVSFYALAIKH